MPGYHGISGDGYDYPEKLFALCECDEQIRAIFIISKVGCKKENAKQKQAQQFVSD